MERLSFGKHVGPFLLLLAIVVLFAWGTRYRSSWVYGSRMWLDEAGNLQFPYHLVQNGKYGINPRAYPHGERVRPIQEFAQMGTTGPAVLLPVAAMYKLGGYPIARWGRQLIFWFLVLTVVVPIVYVVWRTGNYLAILIAAYGAAVLPNMKEWNQVANEVLGEGPGVGYLLLGCALFFFFRERKWKSQRAFVSSLLAAGFVLGLSVQSKFIFFLPLSGMLLFYVYERFQTKDRNWTPILWTLLGFTIPTLLYEFWQLVAFGPTKYAQFRIDFFKALGSISGGAVTKQAVFSDGWFASCAERVARIWDIHQSKPVLLLLTLAGFFQWTWGVVRGKKQDPFASSLLFAGLLHLLWFVFASGGAFSRHYIPGGALIVIGSLIALSLRVAAFKLSFSSIRLSQLQRTSVLGFFVLFTIVVSGVRMAKPLNAALYDQEKLWKFHMEIEKRHRPWWFAQNRNDFNPLLHLLMEVPLNPFVIDVLKDECKDPGLEDQKTYALIWRKELESKRKLWQCQTEIDPGIPKVSHVKFDFALCKGSELVCR